MWTNEMKQWILKWHIFRDMQLFLCFLHKWHAPETEPDLVISELVLDAWNSLCSRIQWEDEKPVWEYSWWTNPGLVVQVCTWRSFVDASVQFWSLCMPFFVNYNAFAFLLLASTLQVVGFAKIVIIIELLYWSAKKQAYHSGLRLYVNFCL